MVGQIPVADKRSAPTELRLFREARYNLDVRRIAELIDRRHRREPITAVDQKARVAGERRRIARHGNDDGDVALRKRARLRLRALARRIEQHRIEAIELFHHEWPAEQIALLD